MDRQIVCFAIPSFQVALARLADTSLQERPVAIAPSLNPRAIITEASQEARRDGVCVGMSVAHARYCCPSVRIVPPHPARVREADQALVGIIQRFAPVWEPVRSGDFFLDLTGTTRLFGLACDTAMRIEREVTQQYRLVGVSGVGSSKLVSRIASTLVTPPQLCDVRPGSEDMFLAPLPVQTLPLEAQQAKKVLMRLDDLNLRTLGDVADVSLVHLEPVLGSHARLVHAWARGIDASPVVVPARQPCLEATFRLASDEIDAGRLWGLLYGLLEQVCRNLRRQGRVCHQLTLSLQYGDEVSITKSRSFRAGTCWEDMLIALLAQLFRACFQRRVSVRVMTLRGEALALPDQQCPLFEPDDVPTGTSDSRTHGLILALDRIRARFGPQAIWWGKTHSFSTPGFPFLRRTPFASERGEVK